MDGKTALLLGASGLVGSYLLEQLLENSHYSKVISIGRSKLERKHPKLEQIQTDLNQISDLDPINADELYCALGSTIKKAGTQKAFRKVDYDFVVNGAKWAQENGVKKMGIVSALGADSRSLLFYNRVKGDAEQALIDLGFEQLVIARPSFILGERKESRMAEEIFKNVFSLIGKLFFGPFKKFRSIHAREIAAGLIQSLNNTDRSKKVEIIYFS